MAELKARGVVFEEYDTPEVKTVKGVATIGQSKGAWSFTMRIRYGSSASDSFVSITTLKR